MEKSDNLHAYQEVESLQLYDRATVLPFTDTQANVSMKRSIKNFKALRTSRLHYPNPQHPPSTSTAR